MSNIIRPVCYAAVLAGVLAFVSGCSHPMVVKNIDSYRVADGMVQPIRKSIGVVIPTSSYDDHLILNGVVDGLRKYSDEVVVPYRKEIDPEVDVIASVDLESQYDGSGVNFLISWPGFLVWAPAWNGYVYNISHDFSVRLEHGTSNDMIDSFDVPVDLDIRHAAMNRTWLAETGGWLLPGMSAVALVGGIVHTGYDKNVTSIEAKEVAAPVGDFVAQEIVRRIAKESERDETINSEIINPELETSTYSSVHALNK